MNRHVANKKLIMNPKDMFKEGFNCAQSVFVPFAVKQKVDKNIALRLMSPFGGGIAGTDNLCGAVTGGITVIGLSIGHSSADDVGTKKSCATVTKKFIKEFKQMHGSIHCTPLIDYNLGVDGEREKAVANGVFETKCPKYVESASKLVEKLLNE